MKRYILYILAHEWNVALGWEVSKLFKLIPRPWHAFSRKSIHCIFPIVDFHVDLFVIQLEKANPVTRWVYSINDASWFATHDRLDYHRFPKRCRKYRAFLVTRPLGGVYFSHFCKLHGRWKVHFARCITSRRANTFSSCSTCTHVYTIFYIRIICQNQNLHVRAVVSDKL